MPSDSKGDAAGGVETAAEGQTRSTHFMFDHKVFTQTGGHFALSSDKTQAVFHVPLGETSGAIPLPTLRKTFEIPAEGPDDQLLKIVEKSLKFVKIIRPGESIPREILDGTASWSVEDRHRRIAQGRLALQLSSWISGSEVIVHDVEQLEQMVEDPGTKTRVQEALTALAERLGLPAERRGEVVNRIESFGHELAYIEALRERYGKVRWIVARLADLQSLYRLDRSIVEDVSQINRLFKKPFAEFDNIFVQVDGQTGEILALLKNFAPQVQFTRRMRDELHMKLMDWDELITKWEKVRIERAAASEAMIKETYRFLAQRYLQTTVWRRAT
ncbi:MAG: hypothetical protein GC191_15480 [Azospirillum sp.]|nr:hypothetical protein [Azospirillum sp.]